MLVAQSCPTLCDPMDCDPPGSSVHGILQARILEWLAVPFSRGSPWPRDQTWVSCNADRFFTGWATLFSRSLSSVKYPSLSDLFLPETMLLNIPGTLSGKYLWNTPFSYVSSLKSHHDPLWGCQLSYLLLDNNLVKKTARRILIHYCFFFFFCRDILVISFIIARPLLAPVNNCLPF